MQNYIVSKTSYFCYGHRIIGNNKKCMNIHGHNAKFEVQVSAKKLNEFGMVVDFLDLKEILNNISNFFDHKLILEKEDPIIEALKNLNLNILEIEKKPTAENLAEMIFNMLSKEIKVFSVKLWESEHSFAEYREEL